jgi:predicted enzyme related to lactoylglutathione lyase
MPEGRTSAAVGRLGWIQVDCADPERIAPFWAAMLGTATEERLGDPPQYINLAATDAGAPHVSFQRVPEPKVVKNRLHFDLAVDDRGRAARRVERLGGRRLDDFDLRDRGYAWRRMADPDDNEFCLIYDL